ncbi:hypothetical protein DL765_006610 [Monosporascus sp. GIB2]|nr:hypothetical protein DL765_006610 [Monosporascus sp. GIB2]
MNRSGRGIKRLYDEGSSSRPSRTAGPVWEGVFERRVRELKQLAIMQHGDEQGIPVLSFQFVGERQIRESHQALSSFGRGSSLRDRVTTSTHTDGSGTERASKRQKKGKDAETPAQASEKGGKKDGKGKREEKPKKEDKATILKHFDDDLDHYFKENAEKETPSASASKQEAKVPVVKDAGNEETDKAPVEKHKEGAEQEKSYVSELPPL